MKPSNLKIYNGFLTLWIVLLVIVIGVAALFAFGIFDMGRFKKGPSTSQTPQTVEDQQTQNLEKLSSLDQIVDIQKDLDTTDIDNLDLELPDVDKAASEL